MDSKIAEQILDELAPTFEGIESQSAALLQFLKEKGIASDQDLAPYLEQAAAASSVRWRALRVRMGRLFSLAEKSEEEKLAKKAEKTDSTAAKTQAAGDQQAKAPEPWSQPAKADKQTPAERSEKQESQAAEKQSAGDEKREEAAQQRQTREPSSPAAKDKKQPSGHDEKPFSSEKPVTGDKQKNDASDKEKNAA